jgi:hypothetical protein
MIGVVVALGGAYGIGRRIAARLLTRLHAPLPADHLIVESIVSTAVIVTSWHLLGVVALVSGLPAVHVLPLSGIVMLIYLVVRRSYRMLPEFKDCSAMSEGSETVPYPWWRLKSRAGVWSLAVATGIVGIFLLESLTKPPLGWDTLVYHLPLAAKWFQGGTLEFLHESWKFQMPSNAELLPLLLMFVGEERVLSFTYVPFTLLSLLLVYGFARRFGASHEWACLGAIGFGTMPIVLHNTLDLYVDMFVAYGWLGALYLLFWAFERGPSTEKSGASVQIVLAGLAFGLALGSRYILVPMFLMMTAICAGGVFCFLGLGAESIMARIRRAGFAMLAFVLSSLVPSCYWYWQNWLVTGNPMHPLHFSFGGSKVVSASIGALYERMAFFGPEIDYDGECLDSGAHSISSWLISPWRDCWYAGDHFSSNWGFGPVFTTFVPAFTLVCVLIVLASALRGGRVPRAAYPLMVAGVIACYWWFYVFNMLRTLLPVIGVLFALMAYGASLMSERAQRAAGVLFLTAMVLNGLLVVAKPIRSLTMHAYRGDWSRSGFYGVPKIVDELPPGSVILNAAHELKNYPLFGRRLQNHVVTDRVLLEPSLVTVITDAIITKYGIDYIYYDTAQRWTIADSVTRQVVYEQTIDNDGHPYTIMLFKIVKPST